MSSNFLEINQTELQYVEVGLPSAIIVEQTNPVYIEVVTEGPQGPPGERENPELFLQKENHLAEYANDIEAQQSAQSNLGLGVVDPLAYYILAKA